MTLIDRLAQDEGVAPIHGHTFSAALWFLGRGRSTRANIVNAFNLDATDQVQLDKLITHFQGLTQQEKDFFHSDLEAALVLLQEGIITKAQFKNLLGMT